MWLCGWGVGGKKRDEINGEAFTLLAEPDAGGESPLETGRRNSYKVVMAVGYSQPSKTVVSRPGIEHILKEQTQNCTTYADSFPCHPSKQLSNTYLLSTNTVTGIISGLGMLSSVQEEMCGLCGVLKNDVNGALWTWKDHIFYFCSRY